MEDLIKLLGKFFKRDLLYIIGGSSVILSFLYYFDLIEFEKFSNFQIGLILSIGFIIGFVIQEVSALLRIILVRYPNPENVGWFRRFLYKRFTFTKWDVKNFDYNKHVGDIIDGLSEKNYDRFQRIIFLKHIGATIGSNLIISSIIIVLKSIKNPIEFNISLAICLGITAILLLFINWIKSLQEIEFIYMEVNKKI